MIIISSFFLVTSIALDNYSSTARSSFFVFLILRTTQDVPSEASRSRSVNAPLDDETLLVQDKRCLPEPRSSLDSTDETAENRKKGLEGSTSGNNGYP